MRDPTPASDDRSDGMAEPLHVSNGVLPVSRALRRALDADSITYAEGAADVFGMNREPALVLIVDSDVVLVAPSGTRRWETSELDRVEGEDILTRWGIPLPISGWNDPDESEAFRAAVRALLGQPEGTAAVSGVAAPTRARRILGNLFWAGACVAFGAVVLVVWWFESLDGW
jgi:hypothetical protein